MTTMRHKTTNTRRKAATKREHVQCRGAHCLVSRSWVIYFHDKCQWKCYSRTQLSHAIHSSNLTVTPIDTCHVIKMEFGPGSIATGPTCMICYYKQLCSCWYMDKHALTGQILMIITCHVTFLFCWPPTFLRAIPAFPYQNYDWEALQPGAALQGALSKACQPCSFQWLSILTSCRARRLSPTGPERADRALVFWRGCDGNAIKTGPSVLLAIVCLGLQSRTKRMMFRVMFNSSARCCHYWV